MVLVSAITASQVRQWLPLVLLGSPTGDVWKVCRQKVDVGKVAMMALKRDWGRVGAVQYCTYI